MLLELTTTPDICWYPGSGTDLVPLLLDVPVNPTGRRLLRMDHLQEEEPLLYWMNDYGETLGQFPEDDLLGKEFVPKYDELWKEHKATATVGSAKECYRFGSNGKLTLFTVTVRNRNQGAHTRPESGDEYLVCFSNGESEELLKSVFATYRFHLHAVMLIKQGGFSMQRRDFNQYEDLPNLIATLSEAIGEVNNWIIDGHGLENGLPRAKSLKSCKNVGKLNNWGWESTELFTIGDQP